MQVNPYLPKIEYPTVVEQGKKGKRLKIENIEKSIAYKTESDLRFYNRRNFIPLKVRESNNRLVTVYVNINSLAKSAGIKRSEVIAQAKAKRLESFAVVLGKETQGEVKNRFVKLKGLDSKINDRTAQKMMRMVLLLEQKNPSGRSYLDQLEHEYNTRGAPILKDKSETKLPYSLEYHGKTENGEPILYIKYNSNFASGGFKSSTKALDFYSDRILVKSKVRLQVNKELQALQKVEGVGGMIQTVKVLEYTKNGRPRVAIYTNYQNLGDLRSSFKNVPPEMKKEVILLSFFYLLETLENLHAHQMAHHDVHQGNILWAKNKDDKYEIYLSDPGQVRTIKDPEEAWGDIYRLGYLFWNFLTKAGYESEMDEISELIGKMQQLPGFYASDAKAELEGILRKMGIDPENNPYMARVQ